MTRESESRKYQDWISGHWHVLRNREHPAGPTIPTVNTPCASRVEVERAGGAWRPGESIAYNANMTATMHVGRGIIDPLICERGCRASGGSSLVTETNPHLRTDADVWRIAKLATDSSTQLYRNLRRDGFDD